MPERRSYGARVVGGLGDRRIPRRRFIADTRRRATLAELIDLGDEDWRLVERYRDLLASEAPALAAAFYDLVLAHPETRAVFAGFSVPTIQRLIDLQAQHATQLLDRRFDEAWRRGSEELGRRHFTWHVDPAWLAAGYVVYWQHWGALVEHQVPIADRVPLLDALARIVIADLMLQLEGFARAAKATVRDRVAVFDALVEAAARVGSANAIDQTNPLVGAMLETLCRLVSERSREIVLVAYVLRDPASGHWTLAAAGGGLAAALRREPPTTIVDAPLESVLEGRRSSEPIVLDVGDRLVPRWDSVRNLPFGEVVLVPFAAGPARGLGVVVTARGFARRVGLDYFEPIQEAGALALNLLHVAERDPLTGLANRSVLTPRLETLCRSSRSTEDPVAVALLDLDRFKEVNDLVGHETGDRVLRVVARALAEVAREGDLVVRMGGDEFALVLPGRSGRTSLAAEAERWIGAIRDLDWDRLGVPRLSGSVGITSFPADRSTVEGLVRHAELALYDAKARGGDRASVFVPAMEVAARRADEARTMVVVALERGRVSLDYQPIVSADGAVEAMEALIRIDDPDRGRIGPAVFGPALDHPALARRVGRWVLEEALAQLAAWHQAGFTFGVSVNISPQHLLDPRFVDDVARALVRLGPVPSSLVELEITETAALGDTRAVDDVLEAIAELGLTIAIDDFGVGHASLRYLRELPARTVKIDQSFVRGMLTSAADFGIVVSSVQAALFLGRRIVIEGVEDAYLERVARSLGEVSLQGFYLARPMPAEAVARWLDLEGSRGHDRPRAEDPLFQRAGLGPLLSVHHALMGRLEAAVVDERDDEGAPWMAASLDDCHLGRWLASDAKRLIGDEGARSLLHQVHDELHARLVAIERRRSSLEPAALDRLWQEVRAVDERFVATLRGALRASLADPGT